MLYFASQAVGVDLDTGITQGTLKGRGEGVVRGYKYCFVFQAEDILPTLNELVNPYDQPLTEEDLDLPRRSTTGTALSLTETRTPRPPAQSRGGAVFSIAAVR